MTGMTAQTEPQSKKTILLATPCGADGNMTIGTVRGTINTSGSPHAIHQYARGGSLLTYAFNMAWCAALNGALGTNDGPRFTHFVMMHSDIQPLQTDWLDILISELDATDVDVLSVVAPLKNEKGLTSTAIDTNRWRPRRLTMTEVCSLPETFTRDDAVGLLIAEDKLPMGTRPGLLINTGLMIVRLDREWCPRFPGFHINDRIGLNRKGELEAFVEPEDWNFSRWCNGVFPASGNSRVNAKIAATRKVKLHHQGVAFWNNAEPWGCMKTDEINTPEAIVASGLEPPIPGS